MRSRSAFTVSLILLLLTATSGCTQVGDRAEITINRDPVFLITANPEENLTLVETFTGWQTENGTNVPDDCVAELRKRIAGEEEVNKTCSEVSIQSNLSELDKDVRSYLRDTNETIRSVRESMENLSRDLEKARRNNNTERIETLESGLDDLSTQYQDVKENLCEPVTGRQYIVSIYGPDPDSESVLAEGFYDGCNNLKTNWTVYSHGLNDSEKAVEMYKKDGLRNYSDVEINSDRVKGIIDHLINESNSSIRVSTE